MFCFMSQHIEDIFLNSGIGVTHTEGGREGNALFNDALNTFYSRLYGERERNVLFNDALNIFYPRLYGVRHMVKDHSDSEI